MARTHARARTRTHTHTLSVVNLSRAIPVPSPGADPSSKSLYTAASYSELSVSAAVLGVRQVRGLGKQSRTPLKSQTLHFEGRTGRQSLARHQRQAYLTCQHLQPPPLCKSDHMPGFSDDSRRLDRPSTERKRIATTIVPSLHRKPLQPCSRRRPVVHLRARNKADIVR